MNNQDDAGSLQRVALPANAPPTEGGSDSRSETLSPREWPTLEAELDHARKARQNAIQQGRWLEYDYWLNESVRLMMDIDSERRRRPGGESDRMSDGAK